jgi:cytochrome c peroxidase
MRINVPTRSGRPRLVSRLLRPGLPLALLAATTPAWAAFGPELPAIRQLHSGQAGHLDQKVLYDLVASGQRQAAFTEAFAHGDELFETVFNALDGVGAFVTTGTRFTRVPRADLTGPGEWENHVPKRITGPNAQSCNACHAVPSDDGAGLTNSNVFRDPTHSGNMRMFIQRNTPPTFGLGPLQRLAEEMTDDLVSTRQAARDDTCTNGGSVTRPLTTKGIGFGAIKVTRDATNPCRWTVDTTGVVGVDGDLIVRPFQWKGSVGYIRAFNRDAAHNELGMQGVELVGENVDGDFDGVANELTVGDITALSVYLGAQPRPTTKLELEYLGLIPALSSTEKTAINRGQAVFGQVGCTACHTPRLSLDNPIFSEPSRSRFYRDRTFPAGQDPVALWVDPARAVTFDLTRDQPDNQVTDPAGRPYRLGSLQRDASGKAYLEPYGDLKRHDLGPQVAEPIKDDGIKESVFMTENLWGVGSTGPYLHDGRATTLTEAILAHGGEAAGSQRAFINLPLSDQQAVIAFLNNLVLFKKE